MESKPLSPNRRILELSVLIPILSVVFSVGSTPPLAAEPVPTPVPRSIAPLAATPLPTIVISLPNLPEDARPLEMAWVPAGTFTMGSSGGEADETPQHQVSISGDFYIGKYEVTQAQWEAVAGSNPLSITQYPVCGDSPVYMVNWNDCQEFIRRLNNLGLGTFRLPTEAEWEYVCRVGTSTRYYWGDDPSETEIPKYAWYKSISGGEPHYVGLKIANDWGVLDMSGNVSEWCSDWYGEYPSTSQVDPQGPSSGTERVHRGGSWQHVASDCRSARRGSAAPDERTFIGLRLVRLTEGKPIPTVPITPILTPVGTPTTTIIEGTPTPTSTPYRLPGAPTESPTPTNTRTPEPGAHSPTPTASPTPTPLSGMSGSESGTMTKGNAKKTLDDGEPINMAIGEYYFTLQLLNLPGVFPFDYQLYYGSQVDSKRFRDGFTYPFISNHRILLNRYKFDWAENEDILFVELGLGEEIGFHQTADGWRVFGSEDIRYQLKETENYFYLVDPAEGTFYAFEIVEEDDFQVIALLTYVCDRNGNWLKYENPTGYELQLRGPDRVYDAHGRELKFTCENKTYDRYGSDETYPFLTKIEDHNGRTITFGYEANPDDSPDELVLRSITDPMGTGLTLTYAGEGRVASQTMPNGNTPYTQTYNEDYEYRGVVQTQTDAFGNVTSVTPDEYVPYVMGESQFTIEYPDGSQRTFQHDHNASVAKSVVDPNGNEIKFKSDPVRDRVTGTVDRLGDTTEMTFHDETGFVSSYTNAEGQTTSYTYTPQEQTFTNPSNNESVTFTFYNLTQIDYPDGTYEEYTYDANGNVLTWVDSTGKTWTYIYNSRGQILTETNPKGGIVTYTYNDTGLLASLTDSDTGVIAYEYDVHGRLTRSVNPDGTSVELTYNLNDAITSVKDESGRIYTYTYDSNGNLIKETDPHGKEVTYAYDAMDRVIEVTDKFGKKSTITYDSMGCPATLTYADGQKIVYSYDKEGRVTQVQADEQKWSTSYDLEGVPSSDTSPLGRTVQYETNESGFTTAVTQPSGQATTIERDAFNRVVSVTNPLSQSSRFTYNDLGELSGASLPGLGTVRYSYDDLGRLNRVTDLNGHEWSLGYTSMGRLESIQDPLGNKWEIEHDSLGRDSRISMPDGTSQTILYDPAGNVSSVEYSDGTSIEYTYDALDNLVGTNNLELRRDAEGRIIQTTITDAVFDASYEDRGNLTSVGYDDQALTVRYSYDAATGLLTQVNDDLTGAQVSFEYDLDGRPSRIVRSNGVTTTLTWDLDGNPVRVQDGEILDFQYSTDAAGRITQMEAVTPLDAGPLLVDEVDTFAYDLASQLNSSQYAYDAQGRLITSPDHTFTWDGASRLTGIDDVSLRYNGLGDPISRAEGGTTIQYERNYAIATAPIVAERDGTTDSILRYYVWAPHGELLYMIDAANNNKVHFYHYDFSGSTLALTDATGAVTDAYSYTPYGRLLQHSGDNRQPFTFGGRWGVRQESPDGLYQMGERYYDATAGRFLTRDPLWPATGNPLEANPYQYAFLNPLHMIDPTGYSPDEANKSSPGFIGSLFRSLRKIPYVSLRTTPMKSMKWARIPKKVGAYLELLHYPTGQSWMARKLGISSAFQRFVSNRVLKEVRVGRLTYLKWRVSPGRFAATMKWAGRLGTAGTLIHGAIAWMEIIDRTAFTSASENSRLSGKEKKSRNLVIRGSSHLGTYVAEKYHKSTSDYYKYPELQRRYSSPEDYSRSAEQYRRDKSSWVGWMYRHGLYIKIKL